LIFGHIIGQRNTKFNAHSSIFGSRCSLIGYKTYAGNVDCAYLVDYQLISLF